jgi:hypothetical protein
MVRPLCRLWCAFTLVGPTNIRATPPLPAPLGVGRAKLVLEPMDRLLDQLSPRHDQRIHTAPWAMPHARRPLRQKALLENVS